MQKIKAKSAITKQWNDWLCALLLLVTHGVHLVLWAYLMNDGLIEPNWDYWRIYLLTALVAAFMCAKFCDGKLQGMMVSVCVSVWLVAALVWSILVPITASFIIPWWREAFSAMLLYCWAMTCFYSALAVR